MPQKAPRPAAAEADQDLLRRLSDLIDGLEVRDVRTVKWAGELHRHFTETGDATVEPHVPRFRVTDDEISVWFDYTVHISDVDGEVATVEVGTIVDFDRVSPSEHRPDEEVLSCFADTNAFFIAFPYIRESVHTVTRRLGLAGVVLGMARRNIAAPAQSELDRLSAENAGSDA